MKSSSPTKSSGATSLSPIGSAFMYKKASSKNHGNNVLVSSERTDLCQITNTTFYYIRSSIYSKNSLKSMGGFRVQLLLAENTWNTHYTIEKNN